MSVLGEVISKLATNGGFGEIFLFIILMIGSIVGGVALTYKAINFIKINLGNTDFGPSTKADIIELEEALLSDLKRIMRKIEHVENKVEDLESREIELRQIISPMDKDLQRMSKDNDIHYIEINRNLQDLSKSLSSLRGTLIGLGVDRQNLK